ncbi:MAG TPA: lipid-A-disaccharide synthase, partial [Alphaproteobacteria bacterium]|nr:lipid-A-disaccharide synthase [Alphaproteobacteria bacterium]
MTRPARILLVAAESSGDRLGADLMRAMRSGCERELEFFGTGGAGMAAEGLHSAFDISELSVLGLFEAVSAYPRVVRRADEVAALANEVQPDIAVLIDSWGFTLRVAQRLRAQIPDLPLVKFVGPQVWATRAGRAATLAKTVDHLLTIHSFDAPMFEAHGLETTFVGNPALEREWSGDGTAFRARHAIPAHANVLSVLFGSRPAELRRIYEPFARAVGRLREANPDLSVVVPLAEPIEAAARERLA